MPSVCLEMDDQAMRGTRESEDINSHHLLQQHLYKSRKHVSLFCWIKLKPNRADTLTEASSRRSHTLVVCSTATSTAGLVWRSTRTKTRCRRSSRGP